MRDRAGNQRLREAASGAGKEDGEGSVGPLAGAVPIAPAGATAACCILFAAVFSPIADNKMENLVLQAQRTQ